MRPYPVKIDRICQNCGSAKLKNVFCYFFLKWVSGLADFEDISGIAIRRRENCES
jgi:hypothetical protein